LGLVYECALVNKDRRHLFVTPCFLPFRNKEEGRYGTERFELDLRSRIPGFLDTVVFSIFLMKRRVVATPLQYRIFEIYPDFEARKPPYYLGAPST
jgi:hypothetical protein